MTTCDQHLEGAVAHSEIRSSLALVKPARGDFISLLRHRFVSCVTEPQCTGMSRVLLNF